jgi:hypothetical protein
MHAETDETPRTGPSPRITSLPWGRIETEDGRAFKDAKLWPGGGREWDWAETGTSHVPGIQPAAGCVSESARCEPRVWWRVQTRPNRPRPDPLGDPRSERPLHPRG